MKRFSWLRRAAVLLLIGVFCLIGVGVRWLDAPRSRSDADPAAPTVLYDRYGVPVAEIAPRVSVPVGLDGISPPLIDAVLAVTGPDFLAGEGPDFRSRWSELFALRPGRPAAGGTTAAGLDAGSAGGCLAPAAPCGVTSLYLAQASSFFDLRPDSTGWRDRLASVLAANRLERTRTRADLTEDLLNTLHFGRGAYGAEAGAQAWFGRSAAELDLASSLTLAALALGDVARSEAALVTTGDDVGTVSDGLGGTVSLRHLRAARDAVAEQMHAQQRLTDAERAAVLAVAPQTGMIPAEGTRLRLTADVPGLAGFVEATLAELISIYGVQRVEAGGLHAVTTLDLAAQRSAHRAVVAFAEAASVDVDLAVMDRLGGVRAVTAGVAASARPGQADASEGSGDPGPSSSPHRRSPGRSPARVVRRAVDHLAEIGRSAQPDAVGGETAPQARRSGSTQHLSQYLRRVAAVPPVLAGWRRAAPSDAAGLANQRAATLDRWVQAVTPSSAPSLDLIVADRPLVVDLPLSTDSPLAGVPVRGRFALSSDSVFWLVGWTPRFVAAVQLTGALGPAVADAAVQSDPSDADRGAANDADAPTAERALQELTTQLLERVLGPLHLRAQPTADDGDGARLVVP